ncbi:hypothetical protein ONZ51_g12442 [Trametes cubensis]|uniref:DUF6535 domain-containing protein n=1 Tax=Trametes cubensis TaxID=1111947 RepID=A0AAD7TGJ5_9APHY|nr:hypothetical protein ONZ51_g12442 [Trametes cubensis]
MVTLCCGQTTSPSATDVPLRQTSDPGEQTLQEVPAQSESPRAFVQATQGFLDAMGGPQVVLGRQYRNRESLFTEDKRSKSVVDAAKIVKDYSNELIKRWREEIDAYLVFAGLLSAILTAFNVESYRMLQTPSESPESIMAAVLQRTLTQKSGLSRAFPPFTSSFFTSSVASSASTLDVPTPTGPSRSTIWLNILWFSSLVLSLSSASIGILVKQWLNEFESGLSGDSDSEQVAKLRQYRLSNLKNCRVGTIVNAIPVLLQAALALFFAGLLVLLWDLNHSVAGVTAAFILATGLFIIGTTVAPPDYAALCIPVLSIARNLCDMAALQQGGLLRIPSIQRLQRVTNGRSYQRSILSRIGWEHETINSMSEEIEADIFRMAYGATLSDEVFASAPNCMAKWPSDVVLKWFRRFLHRDIVNFGKPQNHFEQESTRLEGAIFWCNILLCITQGASVQDDSSRVSIISHLEQVHQVAGQLSSLMRWIGLRLKSYDRSRISSADDADLKQIDWILATTLAICAPDPHLSSSQADSSPTASQLQNRMLRGMLGQPSVDMMAEITNGEAFSTQSFDSSARCAAATAINMLRSTHYSPEIPLANLGEYLYAHAALLYAFAVHKLNSESKRWTRLHIPLLATGVYAALSELNTALENIAHYLNTTLTALSWNETIEIDVLSPHHLSHIFHTLLSHLDTFRPLLPSDFDVHSEAFFDALKKRAPEEMCDEQDPNHDLDVPWSPYWTFAELEDDARHLIELLRKPPSGPPRPAPSLR